MVENHILVCIVQVTLHIQESLFLTWVKSNRLPSEEFFIFICETSKGLETRRLPSLVLFRTNCHSGQKVMVPSLSSSIGFKARPILALGLRLGCGSHTNSECASKELIPNAMAVDCFISIGDFNIEDTIYAPKALDKQITTILFVLVMI